MSVTFLSYSSRSGSTFVARQLAERFDLLVVPETQLAYLVLSAHAGAIFDKARIARLVRNDPQIDWVGDRHLAQVPDRGLTPWAVLDLVVSAYADTKSVATTDVLLKLGGIHRIWPQVRSHVDGARLLCVRRDGRAVVNSLLNSEAPYFDGSTSMGYGDVVRSARRWAQTVRKQAALELEFGPAEVMSLEYSDVVERLDEVLGAVGDWAGWRAVSSASASFVVSPNETHIHKLVEAGPVPSREDAWRTELSRANRVVVEHFAGAELAAFGYPKFESIDTGEKYRLVAKALMAHYAIQMKFAVKRVRRVQSFGELIDKGVYFVRRRN